MGRESIYNIRVCTAQLSPYEGGFSFMHSRFFLPSVV